MSEFGKLEGDAEQYAKDHPQQVKEGEQDAEHAVEKKFDLGGDHGSGQQDQGGQQGQGNQQDQGAQQGNSDASQQGQNEGQGQ